MTRAFTPKQKFRILVRHGAVVLDGLGTATPVAQATHGTSDTNRYLQLRSIDRAPGYAVFVRCACPCQVWARLRDIQFDHETPHVSGGPTVISNGRPIRTRPCHSAKSGGEQATTGWCVRVRNKHRRSAKGADVESQGRPDRRRSWPPRKIPPRPFNKTLTRHFDGRVTRRVP